MFFLDTHLIDYHLFLETEHRIRTFSGSLSFAFDFHSLSTFDCACNDLPHARKCTVVVIPPWDKRLLHLTISQCPSGKFLDLVSSYTGKQHRIHIFTGQGIFVQSVGSAGPTSFREPFGLAVCADDSILVADCLNNRCVFLCVDSVCERARLRAFA